METYIGWILVLQVINLAWLYIISKFIGKDNDMMVKRLHNLEKKMSTLRNDINVQRYL